MSADTPRVAGIVLAGGLSSRMGRDKALLPWQGRPLLLHMRALLVAAGADPVRISGHYPEYAGLPDEVPRCGPLGGLLTAVNHLPDGAAWLVPVDMPRLSVELLHRLRDASAADCVIFTGQPLPMRLNIDSRCRILLARMVGDSAGPRSLKALQCELGAIEVPVPPAEARRLANCNTPEDWEDIAS